jgi:FMN-dependent NADH-azoreductase
MTTILRLDTSIKGPHSVSRKLTDKIVAHLVEHHPKAKVIDRDTSAELAQIDGAWVGAAYTPTSARTADQSASLALSDTLIAELKSADVIVIGAPIYNFGVTGPLKNWIDQIARVNETFAYTANGPQGLVAHNPRVIVAYTSGGVPMGSAYDLATPYISRVLGFIGITNIEFVAAEGTSVDEAAAIVRADLQIAALAA